MQAVTADKNDQQSKVIGYIGTTIVHVAIFAILWFLVLGPADPPLTDTGGGMGLSMSLGEPDMGGPSEMPVTEPQPQEPTPPQEQTEQPVVVDETEQEEPDAVVKQPKETPKKTEPKKTPEKPIVTKTPEKPVEKPREADSRSLFKKRTTTVVDGNGYGSGTAPGNQGSSDGKPDGSPDGSGDGYGQGGSGGGNGTGNGRGTGSGSGDGISYDLKGRSIQRKPTIVDTSKETGKVVVSIVVDRNGRVTKAMPNQRGTTTLNPVLLEKARQGALDTKFSPKPDGPEEQFGTMTIEFKFKP